MWESGERDTVIRKDLPKTAISEATSAREKWRDNVISPSEFVLTTRFSGSSPPNYSEFIY